MEQWTVGSGLDEAMHVQRGKYKCEKLASVKYLLNPPLESLERFIGGLPVQVMVAFLIAYNCHRFTLQSKQARLATLRPTEAGDAANITC